MLDEAQLTRLRERDVDDELIAAVIATWQELLTVSYALTKEHVAYKQMLLAVHQQVYGESPSGHKEPDESLQLLHSVNEGSRNEGEVVHLGRQYGGQVPLAWLREPGTVRAERLADRRAMRDRHKTSETEREQEYLAQLVAKYGLPGE